MLLNHARKPVWDWDLALPSSCPECNGPLLARRGDRVVWHWAHRPGPVARQRCGHEETDWHLKWKLAYLQLPGWEIEQPVEIAGKTYRLDATNMSTGRVREFVHSLSPSYAGKHRALAGSGYDILWLFDGQEFGSARWEICRGGGLRRLLKPRAADLLDEVGSALAHFHDRLWRHWRHNVWYPLDSPVSARLLAAYARAGEAMERMSGAEC